MRSGRERFFFAADDSDAKLAYRSLFEINHRRTIERAESFLKHRFDLLGSGEIDLGEQINWHCDFKSGKEWPRVPFHRIRISDPVDRSDIKVPWELSRLQCLTDLGRAYWLTDDETYAEEGVALLESWEKANPVDLGVNWACTMEVAIRAINILWGLHLFAKSSALSDDFMRQMIRLLYYHGQHISENLEFIADGANTNHLLADYLGLHYLGTLFPEFDSADRWLRAAQRGLETEIRSQVLEDGGDYECSLSYHRLVLEMFLSAYLLGRRNNRPFSSEYKDRLTKMILFSRSFVGPSGTAPLIGDNDDGFVVKLAFDDPTDHRPLVDIGAVLFGLAVLPELNLSEERFWFLGRQNAKIANKQAASRSIWHKKSGYVVVQNSRMQVTLNAAPVPERQFGGHKHNDLLSVTLQVGERPVLIDAGTACYTADYDARNRSRSTAAHNTVGIDGLEQQPFYRDRLFYLKGEARAVVDLFSSAGPINVVSAYHTGYQKRTGIVHRRTLWVSLDERMLAVRDEFVGDSKTHHRFCVSFLTPTAVRIDETNDLALVGGPGPDGFRFMFGSTPGGRLEAEPYVWHPRYDQPQTGHQIRYTFSSVTPCFADTLILSGATDPVGSTLFHFLERTGFGVNIPELSVLI